MHWLTNLRDNLDNLRPYEMILYLVIALLIIAFLILISSLLNAPSDNIFIDMSSSL